MPTRADGPERQDPHVAQLAGLFQRHPVWVEAMRRIEEGAASAVYFSHLPGQPWHLVRRGGETLLLPGSAAAPDFVFRFTPDAVQTLAAVQGRVDDYAVCLFDLMLDPDPRRQVGFRVAAPFGVLVGHGHLRLLLESGPKVILFGAAHGIRTVGQLRALIKRVSSSTPEPWEVLTR